MKDETPKLTKGSPSKAIFSMMVPMVIGLIVIIGNGLVDAYFIGQLGYAQLAAVSYAFPVWFILGGIVMGIGVAVMHYSGMEAMGFSGEMYYEKGLFFASILHT